MIQWAAQSPYNLAPFPATALEPVINSTANSILNDAEDRNQHPKEPTGRDWHESGSSPSTVGRVQSWESFDVDEGHYWIAVRLLDRPLPGALMTRPDLAGVKIRVDTQAGAATTYTDWQHSFESRGLA